MEFQVAAELIEYETGIEGRSINNTYEWNKYIWYNFKDENSVTYLVSNIKAMKSVNTYSD